MEQQTGVKLLLEYIEQRIYKVNQLDDGIYLDENIYLSLPKDEFEKIKDQAKEMEKEHIMKAYDDGAIDTMQEEEGLDISIDQIGEESEKYYNLNYNK